MEFIGSSQDFVRALKSPSDPPIQDGPSKINLATIVWDNSSLYVPRKAGVILEWLFTRFQKEKNIEPVSPLLFEHIIRFSLQCQKPLIDTAHWILATRILRAPGDTQLEPITCRISIPNILVLLLETLQSLPNDVQERLLIASLPTFQLLWPITLARTTLESLTDCLWSYIALVGSNTTEMNYTTLSDLTKIVVDGFLSAFNGANASGKKKVQSRHYKIFEP